MATASDAKSGEVFLSYSRTDREAAVALHAALEQAGLRVFRDEDAIRSGERWLTQLQAALEGCSAFVLLVGRDGVQRWVGAEVQVALMRHLSPHEEAQRLPIFPLLLESAGVEALPPFLSLFQATRWSPAEALPGELEEDIRAGAARPGEPPAFDGCPFLGLNAFRRADAGLFFGRRQETLEALACLGDQRESAPEQLQGGAGAGYLRWLQIEGNSGAGKSSLVQAGLLPLIEQGALWARTGFPHWRILGPMMPGGEPLAMLAEVVEQGSLDDAARRDSLGLLKRLEADERALTHALRVRRLPDTAFLLVVDQFEELFTFAADTSRKGFDAQLAYALQDADCPLFLLSTVRADFLDRFESLPRLQAIYNRACRRFFLPTISAAGLREVIEQPARLAGLDVSEIATAILEDARDEPGALPLVENALYLLWEQREGSHLSGARYRDADGLAGMLSAQADALLARLDRDQPQGRHAALELLLRLTRVNDEGRHSRRRISRAEALLAAGRGDEALGERVVRALSGERPQDQPAAAANGALRLVTTGVEQGQGYVDLIHETLVRARGRDARTGQRFGYWPTLYDYVEANRDRDLHRQELEFHTEQWRGARGLGRLTRLAGWRDLRRYRRLPVPRQSEAGSFLAWSRRKAWAQGLVLALVVLYVGEAFLWTRLHDLPLDSLLTLQRFRFGDAPLPEMVDIRPGEFDMGEQDEEFLRSVPSEAHQYLGVPSHTVTLAKAYRLGKFEVTYDQFDYYVWSEHRAGRGGVKYPTTAKGGRGNRPVVNTDWKEASAYAAWLGERRGETCRLPTEAEWEYAARAGTKTAYPWGKEIRRQREGTEEVMANCQDCGSPWDNDQSAPVGSFPANLWDLHDTSGNVWEWTCSLWRERFDGSEKECSEPGDTGSRVVRGGAWYSEAALSRAGARFSGTPGARLVNVGVRVFCWSPIE